MAKKGEIGSVKVLAKEILSTRKAKERMLTAKAHLNSVTMHISSTAAMNKVAGAMAKSTAVMSAMSSLRNVPELQATMRAMSIEMEKAGIIEEMMDDAMAMTESADAEELADEEVNKVVSEITAGMFVGVEPTPTALPASAAAVEAGETAEPPATDDPELEAMRKRLAAL